MDFTSPAPAVASHRRADIHGNVLKFSYLTAQVEQKVYN